MISTPKSILKLPKLRGPISPPDDRASISSSRTSSQRKEVIESSSDKLREPLLEYDDQQHSIDAPLSSNTKLSSPEKKANQCLLQ